MTLLTITGAIIMLALVALIRVGAADERGE